MTDLPPALSDPKTLPAVAAGVFDAALAAIAQTRLRVSPVFSDAMAMLAATTGKIVVTGMGKSGLAARKLAATFASTGSPAIFLNAADALHGDLGMVTPGDVVIMLSNNAGTQELLAMLPTLRKLGAHTLGIFGRGDTELARAMDVLMVVEVPSEGCPLELAPMASTLAAIVVGDALAATLMAARGFTPEDFALRHPGGSLGRRLLLTAADVMHGLEKIPILAPTAGLRDLVAALTRFALGAVCISADGTTLIGLVSDGDIRRAIMHDDPFQFRAQDIMSHSPAVVHPGDTLGQVLAVMENPARRVYVVPVVESDGRIAGLLRMHDIVA